MVHDLNSILLVPLEVVIKLFHSHSWKANIGSSAELDTYKDMLPPDTVSWYPVQAPFSRPPDITSQYVPSGKPVCLITIE